jgi:hypothetical protein
LNFVKNFDCFQARDILAFAIESPKENAV